LYGQTLGPPLLTVQRRRAKGLTIQGNYTWSHCIGDGVVSQPGSGGITPGFRKYNRSSCSGDRKHIVNLSTVVESPRFANNTFRRLFSGWQLSGIFRWNTGLPVTSPFDDARWATNWNVQANVTPTAPLHTCPTRVGTPDPIGTGAPKLFGGSSCDVTAIYQSFRNAYPGETGPRNYIRLPGYSNADLGLAKSFYMPWSEKHQLQLRWDVFNVANHQSFGFIDISRTGFGVGRDPALRGLTPPTTWSNFTQIQGNPRVFQIGARYSF